MPGPLTSALTGHRLAQQPGSGSKIASSLRVEVLGDFAAPPNGKYAVFAQRRHLPQPVRLLIDFLKHPDRQPAFRRGGLGTSADARETRSR